MRKNCNHNWEMIISLPAGIWTTAHYDIQECSLCGEVRKSWGDAGERKKIIKEAILPILKKWQKQEKIISLREELTRLEKEENL